MFLSLKGHNRPPSEAWDPGYRVEFPGKEERDFVVTCPSLTVGHNCNLCKPTFV